MTGMTGRPAPRQAAVLVWIPLILVFPAVSVSGSAGQVLADLTLVVGIAAAAVAAVLTGAGCDRTTRPSALAYATLVGLVAVTSTQGEQWQSCWVLVAVVAPAVLRGRWLLGAIVVAVLGVLLSTAATTGMQDTTWLSVGGTALAGASTTSFLRLMEANEALRRTREELARAAVAQERERFSRDLHDLLGHTLSVMVVKAQAVRRLADRDPAAAAAHAGDIEEIGRTALADVRAAVDQTRTLALSEELDRARDALAAAGIGCEVATCSVPPSAGQVLAWVVRESATNVLRHSGAAHCRVQVTEHGEEIELTVCDDGVGGPPPGTHSGGLDGLRHRVGAIGGRFEAGPSEDGFRVSARVPAA